MTQGAWSTKEQAEEWQARAAQRSLYLARPTARMLELAGIQPGQRVLEVGAGTGDLAVQVAARAGSVLATDISPAMLEVAAKLARDKGLTNLTTLASAAEELDLPPASFDAAIARNSLMFVKDLGQALHAVRRALRPGGRFAATTWASLERNPFNRIPIDAVRARATIPDPPPEMITAFTLTDPDRLAQHFRDAGFTGVVVEAVQAVRPVGALEEIMRTARDFPPHAQLLKVLPESEREGAWAEIERRWLEWAGKELPGEQLVVAGAAK